MENFVSLMEKINNPGTFSVSGKLTSIPPGLKIKGFGTVALPFIKAQATDLIRLSEQAPFGRGEDTIVDTSVRNVWQISSENFEITNPEWKISLRKSIDKAVKKQLGLHECNITFKPYKLLIYEKGSFFTLHRDTEKIPNMFATMVINLPSEHEGGELIVSHGNQSKSYSFSNNDGFHSEFVAFYSDCYHEIQPITSGYRVCLIFNLAIENRKKQPLLSQQLKLVNDVGDYISQWSKEKNSTPILTYLLEHNYSEKHIFMGNLKNGDFAKATALLSAAEKNNFQAFLCLVTYYRTSYGDTAYYGRYSSNELSENEFEEYDVDKEEVYAHCITSSDGTEIKISKLYLEENEVLAKTPLLAGPGRGFSISEATGNEGATKDLWYHRGAVIVWPKERDFDIAARADIDYGIKFLKKSINTNKFPDDDLRKKQICLADHIIENQPSSDCKDISKELLALGDVNLIKKQYFKQMNYYDLSRVNKKTFIPIVEHFGWQYFEEEVSAFLTPRRGAISWINSQIAAQKVLSNESIAVMQKWVQNLWKPSLEYSIDSGLVDVLQLVSLLNIPTLVDNVIDFLYEKKQPLFLTGTYGPAVVRSFQMLEDRNYDRSIMGKFVDDVVERIEVDFPSPPEMPTNWYREGQLDCDCEFCNQINKFLSDPEHSEISFYKTLKRNVVHIESKVDESGVDLDVELLREPPKFQGTCRKNQNRYQIRRDLFDAAQKIMEDLGTFKA